MNSSVQQFLVKLVSKSGIFKEHKVNCSSEESAKYICEALYPSYSLKSISVVSE